MTTEDLRVVITWYDKAPNAAELSELTADLGTKPVLLPLKPAEPTPVTEALRTVRVATRHRTALVGRKVGRRVARVRGGSRPGRWLIQTTQEPKPLTLSQQRDLRVRAAVRERRPVLLVVTDPTSAALAWALRPDHPHVLAVMGLPSATRVARTVVESGSPWEDWPDLVGDVNPAHLYAVLPGLADGAPIPQHELEHERAAVSPPPPPSETRLLIGPANYAGQGAAWVRAVEAHLGVPSANVAVVRARSPFPFAADHPVTEDEWELTAVRRRLATEAVGPASHVLVESLRPLLDTGGTASGGWDFAAGAADVRALQAGGRRVGVLLHGSESRRPARHVELYPHSPFQGLPTVGPVARLVTATDELHALLEGLGDVPRFVSTPDMLDFVPGATWMPTVVRRDAFDPGVPLLSRRRPVVLHAPSNPLLKGSDVVDEVLQSLEDEGLLEYRRLAAVPPPLVGRQVRQADVVVDQIALGNIGLMALEAMACGRVVLGHAIPSVLERYGEQVPMGVVDPVGLKDQVRSLLAAPETLHGLAEAGPGFVRRHHDGRRSAEALREFLAS
ncbi:MAG: hypothetical protein M3P04_02775 [Actinomycetota bacterium]|nr:hypothetical protein [Actinomycetota bacterium]